MDSAGEELVGRWLPMGTPNPLIPAKACPVRYGAGTHPSPPAAPLVFPVNAGGGAAIRVWQPSRHESLIRTTAERSDQLFQARIDRAFPYNCYTPSGVLKRGAVGFVSFDVTGNLALPVVHVGMGHTRVLAAVPVP